MASKAELAWREEALRAMAHAAEVLAAYEHLLTTMTEQAELYRTERALTARLLHHWTGAENALRQLVRHLPPNHERAAVALRKVLRESKQRTQRSNHHAH